jgi:cation:H+ antiporter
MDASTLVLGALGLLLLGLGGDVLVRGAVGIAVSLKVSPLFTGLVLVGFGTSTPELVTSLDAVLRGSPGIAVGNVIGSNLANILLILGLTAVILPIPANPVSFRRDARMLALATAAVVVFALTGTFSRLSGGILVMLLLGYLYHTYRTEQVRPDASAELHALEGSLLVRKPARPVWLSLFLAIVGLAAILVGADMLVTSSIRIAQHLGISDTVIGLTVVALGTSLPELATAIAAAIKGETDIALGNVIGSNLFNLLGILGVTALAHPITIPRGVAVYDVWILAAATALLLFFAFSNARIGRWEGLIFLVVYVGYLGFLAVRSMGTF